MPGGEFWAQDNDRVLVAPGPVGRGTDKLTTYDNWWPVGAETYSHLELRAKLSGVTVPTNITNDWSEDPDARTKRLTQRAWNDFKTLTDNLRTNENAGAFNWTKTINASGGAVGPLGYRNEACAAFERWIVDQQTTSLNAWDKFGGAASTFATAITQMLAATPTQTSNWVRSRVTVGGSGTSYSVRVNRCWISIVADSDSLPSSVSKYILAIPIQIKRDDFSRAWSLELWNASGTGYDAPTTLITSWPKASIPAPTAASPPTSWSWIFADITSNITVTSGGTTNYYYLLIDHDNTTSANGTWNAPADPYPPDGIYIEGVQTAYSLLFQGRRFGHTCYAYVDDLTDI